MSTQQNGETSIQVRPNDLNLTYSKAINLYQFEKESNDNNNPNFINLDTGTSQSAPFFIKKILRQPKHVNLLKLVASRPNYSGTSAMTNKSSQQMSTSYNNKSSHDTFQGLSNDPFLSDANLHISANNNSKYDLSKFSENYKPNSP